MLSIFPCRVISSLHGWFVYPTSKHTYMPDSVASYMSNDAGFVKVTLAECHHFHTIVQVYKILHLLVPVYLQDMFMFSENA